MFGSITDGLKGVKQSLKDAGIGGDEDEEEDEEAKAEAAVAAGNAAANKEVSDIDARAQTGELSFRDFLTMSEAFAGLGEGKQLPGMPTLTDAQLAETRQKFESHTKIVEVMLDDEMDKPELLIDDLKSGGSTPGPRIQRLAIASNLPETEVGLFLMQFEAMRESTRRIAAGEDPDEVNTSMSAPPGSNRAARRKAKARKKKSKQ
jgi:signal recognition particle GTPase